MKRVFNKIPSIRLFSPNIIVITINIFKKNLKQLHLIKDYVKYIQM